VETGSARTDTPSSRSPCPGALRRRGQKCVMPILCRRRTSKVTMIYHPAAGNRRATLYGKSQIFHPPQLSAWREPRLPAARRRAATRVSTLGIPAPVPAAVRQLAPRVVDCLPALNQGGPLAADVGRHSRDRPASDPPVPDRSKRRFEQWSDRAASPVFGL
jgi:hypothetical protein